MSGAGQPPIAVTSPTGIPSYADLSAYNVNRDGWEAIRQSLYDSAAYAAAGQPQLSFFSTPVGQGTGVGGGPKTLTDTDMTLAGQMPANQEFLIQSLEVLFFPTIPAVAADNPGALGAPAIPHIINDAYIFAHGGNLNLFIGSKSYLQEAPMLRFPAKTFFDIVGMFSDSTTAGAAQATRAAYATPRGRPYMLQPANLRLVSNQNFGVTLNWPEGNAAITNPARVYVILDGVLYRRSQ